jgi:FkbM family methyltransferase
VLHVACVRWGEKYSAEYVERLHDMVRRNLPAGFRGRFVCFTDRPQDLAHLAGVELAPLPSGAKGWWNKFALFAPDAFPKGDRVWFFDLDTVITGPLETLFSYPGSFAILRDVYRHEGWQSSVMSWIAGSLLTDAIHEIAQAELAKYGDSIDQVYPGGDQQLIERMWEHFLPLHMKGAPWPPDILQPMFPGVLRSYKVDCVWKVPKGTSVVFFHGHPRPHEVLTGWVPEVWKVDGGSAAELVMVGTVAQDKVLQNARVNRAKGLEELEPSSENAYTAVICAGGPSLADHLPVIANMQRSGAALFTTNGVERFLRTKQLKGDFHVMCDARPDMAQMVCRDGTKLYATMCDPSVIEAAKDLGGRLVLWNPATDGMDELVPNGYMIGGGSTVGLRSMALAFAMGFRNIVCVGFDSCYRGDEHHAYKQTLNDSDRVLDCIVSGQRFKAAPWMVQQAEEWKVLVSELMRLGCSVSVYGEGLIAAIASSMHQEITEIDKMWWPSKDLHARPSVLGSVEDLQQYIEMCPTKRVAVQAGGNVGIWPKELSKHFERVHTFEPDPLNYECLRRNVSEPNVTAHPTALGATAGTATISVDDSNCGASHILPEAGTVTVVTVDEMNLDACDLIQLDVEGYELQALKGAEQTIRKHSPLIVLELKNLGRRYGNSDEETQGWLQRLGYEPIGVAHRDVIFRRRSA